MHVFISYSHLNAKHRYKTVEALRASNIPVWTDDAISPGVDRSWEIAIEEAIENYNCVVVLLSPQAKVSPWVRDELRYAKTQKVPIVPFVIAGEDKDSIPISIISAQYIDGRKNFTSGIQELVSSISKIVEPFVPEWLQQLCSKV